jgi:hypothetical protein
MDDRSLEAGMHTVQLLKEARAVAEQLGYQIREEWLGGSGGGGCEIKGRKWIFLDLAVGPLDQLDIVLETLRREPAACSLCMPHQLRQLLQVRKVA